MTRKKKPKKKVKAKKKPARRPKPKTRSAPGKKKAKKAKKVKTAKSKKQQTKPRAPRVKAKDCKQRGDKGLFLPGNTVGVNVPHNTSLTPKVAKLLEEHWKLSGPDTLSDKEICDRIGITINKLNGWLKRNTKVDLIKVIGVDKETGQTKSRKERIGLRHLRTRARAQLKIGYLARMNKIVEEAASDGKHNASFRALEWLLEHQFPKEFGTKAEPPSTEKPKLIRMPLKPPSGKKKINHKNSKK